MNTYTQIRKFTTGENDPTVKEIYKIALSSKAQEFAVTSDTNLDSAFLAVIKSLLVDALRFDLNAQLKITELAMSEAVMGVNPKIQLEIDADGKLISPSEEKIKASVEAQFNNDLLILELIKKNIIKLSLSFG